MRSAYVVSPSIGRTSKKLAALPGKFSGHFDRAGRYIAPTDRALYNSVAGTGFDVYGRPSGD